MSLNVQTKALVLCGTNAGFFFNIFEKTQAQKNSTAQKTQGFFSPKLNEPVVIVVKWISKLSLFLVFLL